MEFLSKKRRFIIFGWTDENVGFFKYDHVIRQRAHTIKGFYPTIAVLAFYAWTGENDLYTLCVDVYFFWKRTELLCFQNIRIPVVRALSNDVSKTIVIVGPFPSQILYSELYIPYNINCLCDKG